MPWTIGGAGGLAWSCWACSQEGICINTKFEPLRNSFQSCWIAEFLLIFIIDVLFNLIRGFELFFQSYWIGDFLFNFTNDVLWTVSYWGTSPDGRAGPCWACSSPGEDLWPWLPYMRLDCLICALTVLCVPWLPYLCLDCLKLWLVTWRTRWSLLRMLPSWSLRRWRRIAALTGITAIITPSPTNDAEPTCCKRLS